MPIDLPSDKHAMPAGRTTVPGGASSPPATTTSGTQTSQSGQPTGNTGETSAPVRSSATSTTSSSSSRPDQASVQAQVVEVKTASTSGSPTQVEAVVRFNGHPTTTSSGPVHTQLDRAVLEAIAQGKPTLVRVVTSAPLKVDQQLAMRINDGQLQLQAIQAPSLAQQIARQVVPLVARQDSLAALLSNLVTSQSAATTGTSSTAATTSLPSGSGDSRMQGRDALLAAVVRALANNSTSQGGSSQTGGALTTAPQSGSESVKPASTHSAAGNPPATKATNSNPQAAPAQSPLQTALSRLWQQIPQLEQLTTGPGIKAAIRNSGLFLEAQLKQITQAQSGGAPSQTRQEKPAGTAPPASASPRSTAGVAQPLLNADLKALLNQLVAALRTTQSQSGSVQANPASAPPAVQTSGQPSPGAPPAPNLVPTSSLAAPANTGTGPVNPPGATPVSVPTGTPAGEAGPVGSRPATGSGQSAPVVNGPPSPQAPGANSTNAANLTQSPGNSTTTTSTASSASAASNNPSPAPVSSTGTQTPAGQNRGSGSAVTASGANTADSSSSQAATNRQPAPMTTPSSSDAQRPAPQAGSTADQRGTASAAGQTVSTAATNPPGVQSSSAAPGHQAPNSPASQSGNTQSANATTTAQATASDPAKTANTAASNPGTANPPRGESTETTTRANLDTRAANEALVYTRPRPLAGLASAPLRTTASEASPNAPADRPAPQPGSPLSFTAPPLPGQIPLQAQSIQRQSNRGRDFADALVSVLLKQGQQALSRMQLHQLSSLHHKNSSELGNSRVQNLLSFELPVWHGSDLSLIQFRIEESLDKPHQDNEGKEQTRQWVVNLSFSLEGIGAIYCQASLSGVHANVTFWAKEPETLSLARNHLKELNDNLQAMGIRVNTLHCHPGDPPAQRDSIKQYLIDVQT